MLIQVILDQEKWRKDKTQALIDNGKPAVLHLPIITTGTVKI